jgi:GNAT superfamily N-acetyltransferase
MAWPSESLSSGICPVVSSEDRKVRLSHLVRLDPRPRHDKVVTVAEWQTPRMNISETVLGDDAFQSYVELFERYRAYYGQAADQARTQAWLTNATTTGPMRAFLARVDGVAAGICLIAICPASLTLGEFWMVRDIFVDPRWRRTGVARALLDAVRAAAHKRGALRPTLETEDDNATALRLYERYGFGPVTDCDTSCWTWHRPAMDVPFGNAERAVQPVGGIRTCEDLLNLADPSRTSRSKRSPGATSASGSSRTVSWSSRPSRARWFRATVGEPRSAS